MLPYQKTCLPAATKVFLIIILSITLKMFIILGPYPPQAPHSPLVVDELSRLLDAQAPAGQTLLHDGRAERIRKEERHLPWAIFASPKIFVPRISYMKP